MGYDKYVSPLSERYASKEMQYIFSPDMKFKTWRKLWIALAETEKELGLNITDEQIAELKEHAEDINYDVAKAREKVVRHDVMSHVYAYGQQCPKAKGIIHLGATSCYVGDNTDIIIMAEALNVLAGIAASAHKFSNDIRLLQHLKEVEEPFEKTQIGSSAMAYKRNPMRSERIASLSRYVMIDALNPAITSATQWFERTLDDSANKRLSVPEGFLAIDGILDLCLNVVDGLVVYPKVIEKRLMSELPFMATENIMMDAVKAGGDRQELHERIRELSMEAGKNVKEKGLDNNLLELIASDDAFNLSLEDLQKTMDPSKYVGRSKEQVEAFLKNVIRPILDENKELLGVKAEINV